MQDFHEVDNDRTGKKEWRNAVEKDGKPQSRKQTAIQFPPGDLDDLIFHDSYPLRHSER